MDALYERDLEQTYHSLRQINGPLSNAHIDGIIDSIAGMLNISVPQGAQGSLANSAQERNFNKWNILNTKLPLWNHQAAGSYAGEINYLKNWIHNRLQFLDGDIPYPAFGTLLLKFIAFSAKAEADANVLHWQVALNDQIEFFVVEKANNHHAFEEIGRVAYRQDNGSGLYQFQDQYPKSGLSLYRIKAVETSGAIVYSQVCEVNTPANTQWQIAPTVVQQGLNLIYAGKEKGRAEIIVFQPNGKKVLQKNIMLKARQHLRLDQLSAGLYFLHIEDEHGHQSLFRFIKK